MSIADKLVTIAENEQKVYHAGQLNVLANAESLNGSLSGEAVSANDVIDIEHNIPCQLTSDTITDFSQVEVSRYGKNIFDDTKIKSGFAPQSGAYPISNSSYPNSQYFELNVYAGQTIYFSVKDGGYIKGRVRYALNGEALGPITKGDNLGYLTASVSQNNGFENGCFQIKKDCTLVFMFLEGLVDIQMQIEYGNKQTDYEPCKKQIYTSTADGVVDGVTSIAPNMTLLTDTEGVVINANYYKDPDIVISNLAQSVALSGGEG